MKKIFSYTLVLLTSASILFSCSSKLEVAELQKTAVSNSAISNEIIGIKEANNYRITCSLDKLKAELEKVLESQQTPTTLVNFRIVAQKFPNTNKEYYLLLANNQDNGLKVGRQLFLQETGTLVFGTGTTTVTCSGCTSGCNVSLTTDGKPTCTPCDKQYEKCTKTETVTIGGTQAP